MRVLLGSDPQQVPNLAWLGRQAERRFALRPGAWVSLSANETIVECNVGRMVWIGDRRLNPNQRGYHDPAEMSVSSPCIIWDRKSGKLTLYAHPLGRGTFFHARDRSVTYASTSIVDICEQQPRLTPNAATVASYFATLRRRAVNLTETFVDGVAQIAPGNLAEWNGASFTHDSYWTPRDDLENGTLGLGGAADRVREALERVLRHEVGSATGCLVSGGLDSSVLAGVATKVCGQEISLLTYGHGLDSPREARLRDDLARHLGRQITELPLTVTDFDIGAVRRENRGADSPSGGLFSGIDESVVEAAGTAGYDTLLTGEGGDEVFDPSPNLLADLIRSFRVRSTVSALAFFGSYHADVSAWRLLAEYGVAPLAAAARVPFPIPASDGFLEGVLGPVFAPKLAIARNEALMDKAKALSNGWSLNVYDNYRQVLDVANYELRDISGDVRVVSPLATVDVLRAANTLRLDQLAGPWLGFRSKRLLARAASEVLPFDVAYSQKTGIGNLAWRLGGGPDRAFDEAFDLSALAKIGIDVPLRWLRPSSYPTQRSLIWALLLVLCIWYQELEKAVHERRSLPDESGPISDL